MRPEMIVDGKTVAAVFRPNWYKYFQSVMASPYSAFMESQHSHYTFIKNILSQRSVPEAAVVWSTEQHFSPRSASIRAAARQEFPPSVTAPSNRRLRRRIFVADECYQANAVFTASFNWQGSEYVSHCSLLCRPCTKPLRLFTNKQLLCTSDFFTPG